jgi:hypothetical protein
MISETRCERETACTRWNIEIVESAVYSNTVGTRTLVTPDELINCGSPD